MDKLNVFWFRRDLRLNDNAGLYHALKQGLPVLSVFIFDQNILDRLPSAKDGRVEFIYRALADLKFELNELGSDLLVLKGKPIEIWSELISRFAISGVFANADHEPYALARDKGIEKLLSDKGIAFNTYKDHCIFDHTEVLKDNGEPYTVFTPYAKKWKQKRNTYYLCSYPTEKYYHDFQKQ